MVSKQLHSNENFVCIGDLEVYIVSITNSIHIFMDIEKGYMRLNLVNILFCIREQLLKANYFCTY